MERGLGHKAEKDGCGVVKKSKNGCGRSGLNFRGFKQGYMAKGVEELGLRDTGFRKQVRGPTL